MYRVSQPLAATQFPGDDKKKKRKAKKTAKKAGTTYSKKNAKEQGFTKMSPEQIKRKKAQILKLEKTDPAKGKAMRAKLMSELKKGYYKQ